MFKNITHKVLTIFNIGLPIAIVISSILIISNSKLEFEFSNRGFNNFLEIFKFPLGLSAALIAILTLTYTIERMRQFERQLILFWRNNRFNNYYRLNEEFSKHFEKQEIFSLFKKTFPNNSVFETGNYLQRFYKHFYGANSRQFTTNILSEEFQKITIYLSEIDANSFNCLDYELNNTDYETLSIISEKNLDTLKIFIKPLSQKLVAPIYANLNLPASRYAEIEKHYFLINELFMSVSFYESLLIFDGQKVKDYSNLRSNFMSYLKRIKLL